MAASERRLQAGLAVGVGRECWGGGDWVGGARAGWGAGREFNDRITRRLAAVGHSPLSLTSPSLLRTAEHCRGSSANTDIQVSTHSTIAFITELILPLT